MIPNENVVRQTPMKVVFAIVSPLTIDALGGLACTSVPLRTALGGRDVLNTGAGVGVMRGSGVMRGAGAPRGAGTARSTTAVPAGGVTWTPTFILKLPFPT